MMPPMLEILMMCPDLAVRMWGMTALQVETIPKKLVSMTSWNSVMLDCSVVLANDMAALLIKTSILDSF